MSINRETLNSLNRNFPLVKSFVEDKDEGFFKSREKYLNVNKVQALWLLDNSDLLLEVLQKHRRITEIIEE